MPSPLEYVDQRPLAVRVLDAVRVGMIPQALLILQWTGAGAYLVHAAHDPSTVGVSDNHLVSQLGKPPGTAFGAVRTNVTVLVICYAAYLKQL